MRPFVPLAIGIVLLVAGVLIVASSILFAFIAPSTFASTVRILTGTQDPIALRTEIEELNSSRILAQVVTNLNLNKKWAERYKDEGEFRTEQTVSMLKGQMKVSQAKNTYLIQITIRDVDRVEAASIANEIAKVYKGSGLAAKAAPVQILEAAQPAYRPERPNTMFPLLGGLASGGCGLAMILTSNRKRADFPPPIPSHRSER